MFHNGNSREGSSDAAESVDLELRQSGLGLFGEAEIHVEGAATDQRLEASRLPVR